MEHDALHVGSGYLVKKVVPGLVRVAQAQLAPQLRELAVLGEQVALAGGGRQRVLRLDRGVRLRGERLDKGLAVRVEVERRDVVRHLAVRVTAAREGARKVRTAKPCDVGAGVGTVDGDAIPGGVSREAVLHRGAGLDVVGALDGARNPQHGAGKLAVGNRVRIPTQLHRVLAALQLVAGKSVPIGVVEVIGGHVVHGE